MSGEQHTLAKRYPWKDPVPILQEAGWAPGPVWTGGISYPQRYSIPDDPARRQLLKQLSYPSHVQHIHDVKYKQDEPLYNEKSIGRCGCSYIQRKKLDTTNKLQQNKYR